MPLLVLCAINGKTLELTVNANTRVDHVQQALVAFTGMPVAEQIAMFKGSRLDPSKTLGAYKLPVPDSADVEDSPVFLYSRLYLKPGVPPPPIETLAEVSTAVPEAPEVQLVHPLHSAPSAPVRALPELELQFQHHLLEGSTFWNASQQRLQRCKQLLSEQEVQARAADAARANVEAHYLYISNSHQSFLRKYSLQYDQHKAILASFSSDLAALGAMELHPMLQTDKWRYVIDLLPASKLQDRAEQCSRSHEHFSAKVTELEGLFNALKSDVEGLFLQAPSVDLDQLGQELSDAESHMDEQASIVQVLSKDLMTVRTVVTEIVTQLGSGSLTGSGGQDACAAMDRIQGSHIEHLLPRVNECDDLARALAQRCVGAKNRMTAELVDQLQRISAQQSKIRDMKNKLAAFSEVLTRQDAAFADLMAVSRLPAAYRYCLSECVRRRAWHHLYTSQAAKLVEQMYKSRDREVAKTEEFRLQVERHIPQELLSLAGLLAEPPHPQVSVPPIGNLLEVSVHELTNLTQLESHVDEDTHQDMLPAGADMAPALHHSPASTSAGHAHVHLSAAPISMPPLEMENSRLKAELAGYIAADCMRELAQERRPSKGGSSVKKGGPGGSLGSPPSSRGGPSTVEKEDGDVSTSSELQPHGGTDQPMPVSTVDPQKAAQVLGGDPSTSGGAQDCSAGVAGPAVVPALQRALRLKDDFLSKLQQENAALAVRVDSYEARIAALESQLASQSHAEYFSHRLSESRLLPQDPLGPLKLPQPQSPQMLDSLRDVSQAPPGVQVASSSTPTAVEVPPVLLGLSGGCREAAGGCREAVYASTSGIAAGSPSLASSAGPVMSLGGGSGGGGGLTLAAVGGGGHTLTAVGPIAMAAMGRHRSEGSQPAPMAAAFRSEGSNPVAETRSLVQVVFWSEGSHSAADSPGAASQGSHATLHSVAMPPLVPRAPRAELHEGAAAGRNAEDGETSEGLDRSVLGRSSMMVGDSMYLGPAGLTDSLLLPLARLTSLDRNSHRTASGDDNSTSCSMQFGSLPFAPSLPSPLAAAMASGQLQLGKTSGAASKKTLEQVVGPAGAPSLGDPTPSLPFPSLGDPSPTCPSPSPVQRQWGQQAPHPSTVAVSQSDEPSKVEDGRSMMPGGLTDLTVSSVCDDLGDELDTRGSAAAAAAAAADFGCAAVVAGDTPGKLLDELSITMSMSDSSARQKDELSAAMSSPCAYPEPITGSTSGTASAMQEVSSYLDPEAICSPLVQPASCKLEPATNMASAMTNIADPSSTAEPRTEGFKQTGFVDESLFTANETLDDGNALPVAAAVGQGGRAEQGEGQGVGEGGSAGSDDRQSLGARASLRGDDGGNGRGVACRDAACSGGVEDGYDGDNGEDLPDIDDVLCAGGSEHSEGPSLMILGGSMHY